MNLSNLIFWSVGIITTWAGIHYIDEVHRGILKAQAKLIYESRTETWGSPKFLSTESQPKRSSLNQPKKGTDSKE